MVRRCPGPGGTRPSGPVEAVAWRRLPAPAEERPSANKRPGPRSESARVGARCAGAAPPLRGREIYARLARLVQAISPPRGRSDGACRSRNAWGTRSERKGDAEIGAAENVLIGDAIHQSAIIQPDPPPAAS